MRRKLSQHLAFSKRTCSARPERPEFTVLIAPSGFKESLGAHEVADRIAEGVKRVFPHAHVLKAPMADGGEGFTDALVTATGGTIVPVRVAGPLGDPVDAFFGWLGGSDARTAVIEMAAAAGLRLVPIDRRNPELTTSRGVGQLIAAALDAGAQRVLLGCGDSGVNDGGAGMAQALGVRLLDSAGVEIGGGGAELSRLARIDVSCRHPRLASVQLDAAVNWHNMLLGERGVARVFGPQKGASPEQVVRLEAALENYAACVRTASGIDLRDVPGAGASGGLGAGFHALLGGVLHPRFDVVMQYLDLDTLMARADLVVTAEGRLDSQTPFGKVPSEVARRAKLRGLPVIALAGCLGDGVAENLKYGIDAFASIQPRPCTLDESMARSRAWLAGAAEDAMRFLSVGQRLQRLGPQA